MLEEKFGFTPQQVIQQNLIVGTIETLVVIFLAYLSLRINPLKITRAKFTMFFIFILLSPYILDHIQTARDVLIMQLFLVLFAPTKHPSIPIFLKHFPIFKRFMCAGVIQAASHAIMHIITSFGLIYLNVWFGSYGFMIITFPVVVIGLFGISHFQKLEMEAETLLMNSSNHEIRSV